MILNYFNICYLLSLTISLLELTAILCFILWRSHTLNTLPKAIRVYMYLCCFPYVLINAAGSLCVAIFYFINDSQQGLVIEILRNFITFGAQQVRNTFFTISLERIVATIYLEKYILSEDLSLCWYMTSFSYCVSFCYIGFALYTKYVPNMYYLFESSNYYLFATHAVTLVVCSVLYLLNKKMYKLSAYRITLQKRHQIFKNVKILNFIFASIIIYTLITPLCSIIGIICNTYKLWSNPYCFWHIFYNLPFLIISLRHLTLSPSSNTQVNSVKTVKNAFGKSLPAVVNPENYFKNLKQQWN